VQIGEGGMGQVYRARDTTLNGDVTLKVLPDSVANDSDRLARFSREAQPLASLNHPNIAHVHGLEESGNGPRPFTGVRQADRTMSRSLTVVLTRTLPTLRRSASVVSIPIR
jgi:serine/threonine protein kinase